MKPKQNPDKKIMELVTSLGVGGAERVVMELASGLDDEGSRVIVVSLTCSDQLLDQYKEMAFPVYFLGIGKTISSVIRGIVRILQIVEKENVDIIHAHMFHSLLFALLCRFKKPNIKIIFTSHSFSGFSLFRKTFIRLTRKTRFSDIVFSSEQHAQLNAGKTEVIPNGVHVREALHPRSGKQNDVPIFLFVGRFENLKNPILLINGLAGMRHKRCELWLAGDGTLKQALEKRARDLSVAERVKFLGVQKDVRTLMEKADCLVMSSRWEGLPIALLEAGASALPVIAPPVGAIPRVLKDGCGYLCQPEELSGAMDHVVGHYEEAMGKGERLRNRIREEYSVEGMIRKHRNLYSAARLSERSCNG